MHGLLSADRNTQEESTLSGSVAIHQLCNIANSLHGLARVSLTPSEAKGVIIDHTKLTTGQSTDADAASDGQDLVFSVTGSEAITITRKHDMEVAVHTAPCTLPP
jgi:hypothetical protein